MKEVKVRILGTTPLLMRSTIPLDPAHPLTQALKQITAKRSKNLEDYKRIKWMEWQMGIYWDDQIGVYIPAENVEACIRDGAKRARKGASVERGLMVSPDAERRPLLYEPKQATLARLYQETEHVDYRAVTLKKIRLMRCRPRFNQWALEFTVYFAPSEIDHPQLEAALEQAGQFVGLCDYRPRYGQFTLESFQKTG